MVSRQSKWIYGILLVILSPLCIELLSGSTPPVDYFKPLTMISLAICYGLPLLLLRELRIRWKLTWQWLLLLPIMGIYIEGIFMQSFFNVAHEDLGSMANVGVWLDVQWPWAIYLMIMHGIFAVAAPLLMMDVLWPSMRDVSLLNGRGMALSGALIILLTAVQFVIIDGDTVPMFAAFRIHWPGVIICAVVMGLLIVMAYGLRRHHLPRRPFKQRRSVHVYGFIYLWMLTLASYFLPQLSVGWVVIVQIMMVLTLLIFVIHFAYRSSRRPEHHVPLLNGAMAYFIMMALMQSMGMVDTAGNMAGMNWVAVGFILLMTAVNARARALVRSGRTDST